MYSPKIHGELIPRIYRAARKAKLPMTTWVSQALERALNEHETQQLKEQYEREENKEHE